MDKAEPPARLYVGTSERNVPSIRMRGLQKGERHHVLLASDPRAAARAVTERKSAVVLIIDAEAMARDGYRFYRSPGGGWLTDRVPSKYLYNPGQQNSAQ